MSRQVTHYYSEWSEVSFHGGHASKWNFAGPKCKDYRASVCKTKWRLVTCKRCLKLKGKRP